MTTTHKGLSIGQSAGSTRTFAADEIQKYSALTGDTNFDEGCIPNPMLGGMVSDLLGTQVPGRGTMWLKQHYEFPAPAYVGEAITATVEISRIRPEKDLVYLNVQCANPQGQVVCKGETLVFVADLEVAKS
jgi:3-hydroxybutyryl-CoA dehydratase